MYIVKHSRGISKHITRRKRRYICIEMLVVLQNNCTTQLIGRLLIVLTLITSFTYNNIT